MGESTIVYIHSSRDTTIHTHWSVCANCWYCLNRERVFRRLIAMIMIERTTNVSKAPPRRQGDPPLLAHKWHYAGLSALDVDGVPQV